MNFLLHNTAFGLILASPAKAANFAHSAESLHCLDDKNDIMTADLHSQSGALPGLGDNLPVPCLV